MVFDLHYTDKYSSVEPGYSVDSRISTGRFMNEADYRYYLSSKVILGAGLPLTYSQAVQTITGGRSGKMNMPCTAMLK
jgi:hypothetical protein